MAESIKERFAGISPTQESREMRQLLTSIQTDLAALRAQFNQLRTDYNAHVHGGVTAGAANTSVVSATSATAVTLNTNA